MDFTELDELLKVVQANICSRCKKDGVKFYKTSGTICRKCHNKRTAEIKRQKKLAEKTLNKQKMDMNL